MSMPVTPLSRIPQPMKGMNWEPAPSNYTSIPAPNEYGDTDFANDDFNNLWNDGAGCRGDLTTIAALGCNTVKTYNWSVPPPPPVSYWQRNHVNFLNTCQAKGLSVIVPISNYFCGWAYNVRTQNKNGAGPCYTGTQAQAETDLKNWILAIVNEVYCATGPNSLTPGPVVMWAIGNEFDNANLGAYGYCEAVDIATIASYIIWAEQQIGIDADNILAFSSPVTTAMTPVNGSITVGAPYNTIMGGAATEALIQAFNTAIGTQATAQRFVGAINSYQIGAQLTAYYTAWPTVFPATSFYYGELGFNASTQAGSSSAIQAQNVYSQYTTTLPQSQSGYFFGSCVFEFSDELWKGPPGSSETMFGIYTFANTGTPPTANEGDHAPVNGASYPVDTLGARAAAGCLQAALGGTTPPAGCTGG
jgi:hypothetical protein